MIVVLRVRAPPERLPGIDQHPLLKAFPASQNQAFRMFGKDDYEARSSRPGSRVILAYQFRSAFINGRPWQ
jgi:hypothetical protein